MSEQPMQLLSFHLGGNLYGINITMVQEIRVVGNIRTLPNTPDYVIGVLDFRNSMVPVLDLRKMFNYDHREIDNQTVLIVVNVEVDEQQVLIAIIVDSVSDVVDITQEQLKKSPALNEGINTEYMRGMFKHDDKIVVVMDLEAVVKTEDISKLQQMAGQVSTNSKAL